MRRAVVVVPQRPRWLLGAIALTTAATITASAALFVLMRREPVPEPDEQIRVVELGGYREPDRVCSHPYLQFTVWRFRDPQVTLHIVDPFGIPAQISCVDAVDETIMVTRWAGPDRVYGTVDDACWSIATACDIGDLQARQNAAWMRELDKRIAPKQQPSAKPTQKQTPKKLPPNSKQRVRPASTTPSSSPSDSSP